MKSKDGLPRSYKELLGLCRTEIRELWNRYFNESPPKSGLNTIRTLWYKIQCEIHDLKIEQKHITKLNRYSADPEKFVEKSIKAKYHIRAGTEIVKCFKGREHRVQVKSPNEFVYNGEFYQSISAVAKVICGKKVSGYDFFGLNNKLYQKSIVKGSDNGDDIDKPDASVGLKTDPAEPDSSIAFIDEIGKYEVTCEREDQACKS